MSHPNYPVKFDAIPSDLKKCRQWVLWRNESVKGKVPKRADNRGNAKLNESSTWTTFEKAHKAITDHPAHGIGFVFAESDHFVGIDLDSCIREDKTLTDWAQEIVDELDSYTEVSPSGNGLKIIVSCDPPPNNGGSVIIKDGLEQAAKRKDPEIAVFSRGKYFTLTGNVWNGRDQIRDQTTEISDLCERLNRKKSAAVNDFDLANMEPVPDSEIFRAVADMLVCTKDMTDGNDGSNRLFTVACRTAEHGLNDDQAVEAIELYAEKRPFPVDRTDKEILDRVNDARKSPKVDVGSEVAQPPAKVTPLTDALDDLIAGLCDGRGDKLYQTGPWLDDFECGPEKVCVIAAPPGCGKTTFAMQYAFDVLDHDAEAKVFVANAEMSQRVLLRRELTRRSGVDSKAIRFANLRDDQLARVRDASDDLKAYADRFEVMPSPFNLDHLEKWTDGKTGLLILDYLQLFSPSDDPRLGVNAVMRSLRSIANRGMGVMAISSVTRGRGKNGSTYDSSKLTMASLKESGDIEYAADSIYLMRDADGQDDAPKDFHDITLYCGKNRNDEPRHQKLTFDKPGWLFTPRSTATWAVEPEEDFANAEVGVF